MVPKFTIFKIISTRYCTTPTPTTTATTTSFCSSSRSRYCKPVNGQWRLIIEAEGNDYPNNNTTNYTGTGTTIPTYHDSPDRTMPCSNS